VIVRTTGFRPEKVDDDAKRPIHEIYAALAQAPERDGLIVTDVREAVKGGRTPLVLTERREHLDRLHGMLATHAARVVVLTGGMGRKKLRAALDELRQCGENEELIVLATGRYISEGFDLSRLDTLFLAMPISWRGTLSQYAGRLHRLHYAKKRVVVYDYADMDVPVLAKMYERRRKGYKSIGYSILKE
jgi:superfamily II DNA or RNA helicase